ncbi:MAG: hypothetical protein HY305_03520 [Sphingobacteriales bacterium]|nr:hypothetical protein [Sphingobacteriales bacterium]
MQDYFIFAAQISIGVPLNIARVASISFPSYSGEGTKTTAGFALQVPAMINLNMGRGATREIEERMGYFVGAGYGYYYHGYTVSQTGSTYNDSYSKDETYNASGPAANVGIRIGVGSGHKNIEVKLSYMRAIATKSTDIFNVSGYFNF